MNAAPRAPALPPPTNAIRLDAAIPLWGLGGALIAALAQLVGIAVWANLESRQNDQNSEDIRKIEQVLDRAQANHEAVVRIDERTEQIVGRLDRIDGRLLALERETRR